jgi:hypothetical protein
MASSLFGQMLLNCVEAYTSSSAALSNCVERDAINHPRRTAALVVFWIALTQPRPSPQTSGGVPASFLGAASSSSAILGQQWLTPEASKPGASEEMFHALPKGASQIKFMPAGYAIARVRCVESRMTLVVPALRAANRKNAHARSPFETCGHPLSGLKGARTCRTSSSG